MTRDREDITGRTLMALTGGIPGRMYSSLKILSKFCSELSVVIVAMKFHSISAGLSQCVFRKLVCDVFWNTFTWLTDMAYVVNSYSPILWGHNIHNMMC